MSRVRAEAAVTGPIRRRLDAVPIAARRVRGCWHAHVTFPRGAERSAWSRDGYGKTRADAVAMARFSLLADWLDIGRAPQRRVHESATGLRHAIRRLAGVP